MNAIVNVNRSWGIGKDNKLLCHIKEDMEFFKYKTLGKIVIYGNNTLKSFPKKAPLYGRLNIVISRDINNILQESKDRSEFCWNTIINKDTKKVFHTTKLFLDSTSNFKNPILLYADSIEKAIEFSRNMADDEDIFVCGGESIYKQMMPYIDKVFVTKNEFDKEADSFFPNLDEEKDKNGKNEWIITDAKSIISNSGDLLEFLTYVRRNKFIDDTIIKETK
jgi:dihydrofolate reductase